MVASSVTVSPEQSESGSSQQQTLGAIASITGIGLHLGQQTQVRLIPAEPNTGCYFVRTDLPAAEPIAATVANVVQTQLSTELGLPNSKATVRTVEHLLSALTALDIDNVRIEIDGPEAPLLDGSAKEWMDLLLSVGVAQQTASRIVRPAVATATSVQSDDALVTAFPSSELRFSYGIDFDLAAIGNQWHSWSPVAANAAANTATNKAESFAAEVAPARTFGLAHQIDYLRQQGLIKGGSLDNALVCGAEGWLNPPLRFDNEPARHKLLDLIGDLSLLGDIPRAHYVAYKASHGLHVALAKKLLENAT